jgi:hypothetical protein
LEELDQVIAALDHQTNSEHGRRGAAKSWCFLEAVRKNYAAQGMRISNHEMQRRMCDKLQVEKVTGYQITGKALEKFKQEIHKLLGDKLVLKELNGKVIKVSWRKA